MSGEVRAILKWCETQTPDQKTSGGLRGKSHTTLCPAYVQIPSQVPESGKPLPVVIQSAADLWMTVFVRSYRAVLSQR